MKSTQSDAPALSHLDESEQIRMVDVSGKEPSQRCAIAQGRVRMSAQAYRLLTAQENGKGQVLNTTRVAGVLAAQRCAELHPLGTRNPQRDSEGNRGSIHVKHGGRRNIKNT